jgi:hypothetical protein
MDVDAVPVALRERLGPEATGGLLTLLDHAQKEGRADVIDACVERFERRVVEEISGVRVQLTHVEATLRQDMGRMESGIRQDTAAMESGIRQDMAAMKSGIRQDMARMESGIRQDMGRMESGLKQDINTARFDLLKWCFLFWIGQVVAMTGILSVMFRLFRP